MGEIVAVEPDGFTVVCGRRNASRLTRVQPARRQEDRRRRIHIRRQARGRRTLYLISRHDNPDLRLSPFIERKPKCPPRSTSRRSPTLKFRSPPGSGPIIDLAKEKLGIAAENLEPYGHYKAKVSMDYVKSLQSRRTAS